MLFFLGSIVCGVITFSNILLYHRLIVKVEGLFKIYTSLSNNDLK